MFWLFSRLVGLLRMMVRFVCVLVIHRPKCYLFLGIHVSEDLEVRNVVE